MKRLFKKTILICLFILLGCIFISCESLDDEYIPNQPIYASLPPFSEAGSTTTQNCVHQTKTVFTKTSENGQSENIDACIKCGYSSSGYKYYHAFSEFNKVCKVFSNISTYSGESRKILINLTSGYSSKTLEFQSNVDEIVFIGTEGQTNSDLTITVLNRNTDIIFDFSNVNISSHNSVLISDACDAKVIIRTHGNSNSLITQRGSDGKNGENSLSKFGAWVSNPGTRGGNASDVINVKGNLEFVLNASLNIYGGKGGKGGDGSTLPSYPSITNGGGGRGGDGGNGGDAIYCNGSISIKGNGDLLDCKGGEGGAGGKGGYGSGLTSSQKASDGLKGFSGVSGLE